MGIKVGLARFMGNPHMVVIEPDEKGSYLSALQGLVGGRIESFDVLFGNRPCLLVNEEGAVSGMPPNRAVWATKEMGEKGYLSLVDFSRPIVSEGDFYTILFGPIVAASYDDDGKLVSISDEEFAIFEREFGGYEAMVSGITAARAIAAGEIPKMVHS